MPVDLTSCEAVPVVAVIDLRAARCARGHVQMTAATTDPGSCLAWTEAGCCREPLEVMECVECDGWFSVGDARVACEGDHGPVHTECCTYCQDRL